MSLPPGSGDQPYAWLTTTGRRSGQPRTVELWFALRDTTALFLAGGGESTHWVQNALVDPRVRLRLDSTEYPGVARAPAAASAEDRYTRQALAAKYQGWRDGQPLSRWATGSFCLAVDLAVPE
ncbi:MAG: nitroreductase family deazaflavin-dependent oxidoreductase [Candidatus Limnocylindrales bacterium]